MSRYSAQQLQLVAEGRWVEILIAAGIPAERLDGRGHACPRCGGRDRFNAFANLERRGAVHCRHCFTSGSSIRPGNGISTLIWWLGGSYCDANRWLADYLGVDGQSVSGDPFVSVARAAGTSKPKGSPPPEIRRMTRLVADAMQRISQAQLHDLSRKLRVSEASLRSLCVGYSTDFQATTWPMRNDRGQIVGIRLRAIDDDRKWSIQGSRSGLFLSRDHRPVGQHAFIVEGASDLAAALDMGLASIGRPSCRGGSDQIADYLRRVGFRRATMVADRDAAGVDGACRLAKNLSLRGIASSVIAVPAPANDLREWHQQGRTALELESLPIVEKFDARPVSEQLQFDFAA